MNAFCSVGDGHADHLDAVLLRRRAASSEPQPQPMSRCRWPGSARSRPSLRQTRSSLSRWASSSGVRPGRPGLGEVGAGVGHVRVEDQLVEVVGQVVVVRDRVAVAASASAAGRAAGPGRPAAAGRAPEGTQALRGPQPGERRWRGPACGDAPRSRAACHTRRKPSSRSPSTSISLGHVGLGESELAGPEHQPSQRRGVVDARRSGRPPGRRRCRPRRGSGPAARRRTAA